MSDTPIRLAELRSSYLANDSATFTRTAHSLKGSSSNVGAARLCALAQGLEARFARDHQRFRCPHRRT
ncbi:MAG: Hpt domain-containing protein [Candidatus Synoicihabitans palmerolidicus]|nr:Hpt domain-containing protein [Candidatus Synoicihabitans palmerolidicus]